MTERMYRLRSRLASGADWMLYAEGALMAAARVADCAGVTPQHLCRVFREAMRMRPGEYLTQRRIQAARALIRTEELPLSEIAQRVGFSSAGYFSTVFRRWVGMSPGEYRRRGG